MTFQKMPKKFEKVLQSILETRSNSEQYKYGFLWKDEVQNVSEEALVYLLDNGFISGQKHDIPDESGRVNFTNRKTRTKFLVQKTAANYFYDKKANAETFRYEHIWIPIVVSVITSIIISILALLIA